MIATALDLIMVGAFGGFVLVAVGSVWSLLRRPPVRDDVAGRARLLRELARHE